MINQREKIKETVSSPDCVITSKANAEVELFYKYYESTPVKSKYLCVTVKCKGNDNFIEISEKLFLKVIARNPSSDG